MYTYLTVNKIYMYNVLDYKQNVHVFDWTKCTCNWLKKNVHVFDWTKCTWIWLNKMYMNLTKQNVHEFVCKHKCTCIWLNKMYMYLTVSKMYMNLTKQNVHIFDCKQNIHVQCTWL